MLKNKRIQAIRELIMTYCAIYPGINSYDLALLIVSKDDEIRAGEVVGDV